MKKILLIDDHVVVRTGIQKLLSDEYRPCEVQEAGDGDSAIETLKKNAFDLVMLDIQMPKTDTLDLMNYINARYPETKVLIFSMNSENIYAKRFLKAGAKGFLSKDSTLDEIKKAINTILNNRKYISESLALQLADESIADSPLNIFDKLSPREFEIATLLLSGQGVGEISRGLNLQLSTVGTHKARVFEKLGVTNVIDLKELANSYNL